MAEFVMRISEGVFHRLEWEKFAFDTEHLVLTHDGVNERRTEVGAVSISASAYPRWFGDYNPTGDRFYRASKDEAKAAVETAHAIYSAQEAS